METLQIDLGSRGYTIYIDRGLLTNLPLYLGPADAWVVITDETVDNLYGRDLLRNWKHNKVHKIVIPAGEESKNLHMVEAILRRMLDSGITRSSCVLALGGGVVGDLAGFCASIYMRGISYIQVPTTLLAQVDSSVGGKTAVNLPHGKNMVGSFYQPQGVFIDTHTLGTLPKRQLISGMAEVIKYGVICDYAFLGYLRRNFTDILGLEEKALKKVITRCCEIKARVVAEDEKEEGMRKILNYGHTIGHALEIATRYQQYTHGEAILIGMHVEALLARKLGLIDQEYCSEILALIQETGINLQLKDTLLEGLIENMMGDKKNRAGKISFILPSNKGETIEMLLTKKEASGLIQDLLNMS